MRYVLLACSLLLVGALGEARAQTPEDSTAIEQAVLDYVEGWYGADAERMDRALAPDLVKRIVVAHPQTGRSVLNHVSESVMVEATRAGGGSQRAPAELETETVILDIYEDMAMVKAVSPHYVDYLHMTKWNGEWVIMNVLWKQRSQ